MNGQVRFLVLLSGAALLALQLGCKDGPLPECMHLNPWLRKEWDADEKYTTTFHKRMGELRAVRSKGKNLPVSEQQRLTRDVADSLREEKSPAMRLELVKTLGTLPTAESQSELIQATTDEDPDVRAEACRGLGHRPNAASVAALGRVLTEDADNDVRQAACRQLGTMRTPESEKLLRQMVDEGDPAMQRTAAVALREAGFAVPVPSKPGESTHLAPERNWAMPFAGMGKGPPPEAAPRVERTAEAPAYDGIKLR